MSSIKFKNTVIVFFTLELTTCGTLPETGICSAGRIRILVGFGFSTELLQGEHLNQSCGSGIISFRIRPTFIPDPDYGIGYKRMSGKMFKIDFRGFLIQSSPNFTIEYNYNVPVELKLLFNSDQALTKVSSPRCTGTGRD
jgi:hypothetical protein